MAIDNGALIAQLVVCVLCVIACVLFLYPVGLDSRRGFRNNSDLICYLLIIVQLIWSITCLILSVFPLYYGEFSSPICEAQTIAVAVSTAGIVSLHALLSIDRYWQLHYGRKLGHWEMALVVFAFMFTYMALLTFDLTTPVPWQVWESQTVCFFVTGSDNFNDKIPILFLAVYSTATLSVITFCYASIFWTIRMASKDTEFLKSDKVTKQHQRFLIRCLLILSATVISYLPNVLGFTIKAFTNKPIPPVLDAFFVSLDLADALISPIVLLTMSERNRSSFMRHICGVTERTIINDTVNSSSSTESRSKKSVDE